MCEKKIILYKILSLKMKNEEKEKISISNVNDLVYILYCMVSLLVLNF